MKLRTLLLCFNLIFLTTILLAQESLRTITGTVIDANNGESLIGVSIMLKGTKTGTNTDINGRYSIKIPTSDQPVLVFSYIGYQTQEIAVDKGNNILNVNMKEEELKLEEVVIVGYGTQSKKSLTGSMMSIASADKQQNIKKGATWKRSGMPENSIRLEVGDNDFLPLQAAQMAVQIDGFRVRVLMDCFFFNDKKNRLEGTFKLRLPTGATPYYFAFGETKYMDEDEDGSEDSRKIKSNKKLIPYAKYNSQNFDLSPEAIEDMDSREWDDVKQARIVSKQKAARAYEQTVSVRIDPALMEWSGADMFSCRVFPLSMNKLHRVVIGYELNMTEALDFREYILTLPDVEKDFKLDMNLYTSASMKPQISPIVDTKLEGNRVYVSLQNPKKREYAIRYNTVAPIVLSTAESNYFAANFRINLPETKQENLPSDAVFLLDVSLSSQPDKFNVWLKLMEEILTKNTDVIKNFSVLCFNIETFWWNRYYLKNNYYNVASFLEYANTLALEGATDIGAALSEASNPDWLKKEKNAPKHIFLMSDADYNWGENNMHALNALIRTGDRVHTYKTGLSGTNNTILDYLSKQTGGFSFTVTGEEEAELTARSFRYRPWNIEDIQVEGVEDFLISGQPSQLYNGQKLIFAGRNEPKGNIYIRVNNGLEIKELRLTAQETIVSGLAKRLYGQLALGTLESYGYQTEEATESYATCFHIPNTTMSFLMLESEYDYRRFGIDKDDAEYFVEKNRVENIIKELRGKDKVSLSGDGKNNFLRWLTQLQEKSEIEFKPDSIFMDYIKNLPDETFSIKSKPLKYRLHLKEQQSDKVKEALENENIWYDNLIPLAYSRKKEYGEADALKLLSSAIERNPGDFVILRDMSIKLTEWGLYDHAYTLARRIIAEREYDVLAYLTAADALTKADNPHLALVYYYICLNSDLGNNFDSFKPIAAFHFYKLLNQLSTENNKYIQHFKTSVESYLKSKDLLISDADIVLLVSWNTKDTDIDIHLFEPSGEECNYLNRVTRAGGKLLVDTNVSYIEMYVLKHAIEGKYRTALKWYISDDTKTASKTKAYIDFYYNWGRSNEKATHKTVILEQRKNDDDVFKFEIKKSVKVQ